MIVKDFLPKKQALALQKTILSKTFPWFWSSETIVQNGPKGELFQFVHHLYNDNQIQSKYYEIINPIIYELTQKTNIKIKSVYRIKVNLIPRITLKEEWEDHVIHKDVDENIKENFISLIYYVHDCDGDTIVYADDKKTIIERNAPKENSCYILNSKTWHRSSVPKENKRRIVINFVFEVESTDIKLLDKPKKELLPKIIVTKDDGFFTYDLNENKFLSVKNNIKDLDCPHLEPYKKGTHRPFGIAFDKTNLFIASNDRLGIFDKQNYNLNSILDVSMYVGTHQILKDEDVLYVCNTAVDCIGVYNLKTKTNKFLDVNTLNITDKPTPPNFSYDKDIRHVNSLFNYKDKIYFCLHNKGFKLSEYGFLDKKTLKMQVNHSTGLISHNIYIKNDILYTLSTGTGELISFDLNTKQENKYKITNPNTTFLRGLIYINGKFLIGCSVNFKTPNPIKHSYIAEVDIIAGTLKKHDLEGIKAINDMQIFE